METIILPRDQWMKWALAERAKHDLLNAQKEEAHLAAIRAEVAAGKDVDEDDQKNSEDE